MLCLTMTPEEEKELQAHLEAVATILFKNTPSEQLQDFESIERNVRDHVLVQVSPIIGNFLTQRHPNQCGAQAATAQLAGCVDGESSASAQTRLESESAALVPYLKKVV
jgi:hypothetical protein